MALVAPAVAVLQLGVRNLRTPGQQARAERNQQNRGEREGPGQRRISYRVHTLLITAVPILLVNKFVRDIPAAGQRVRTHCHKQNRNQRERPALENTCHVISLSGTASSVGIP